MRKFYRSRDDKILGDVLGRLSEHLAFETSLLRLGEATSEPAAGDDSEPTAEERHQAAVLLGRKGGQKGGKARAAKLTPERRREIARKAARARWSKKP